MFERLNSSVHAALLARGQRRHFTEGTTIFLRGSAGEAMFLIETGRVEVSVTNLAGRLQILEFRGPGEVVGEMAVLDGGTRSADVSAATDVTGVIVTASDVRDVMLADPQAMLGLIRELCLKLRETVDLVEAQANKEASARLAQCVLHVATKWGENKNGRIEVAQHISQGDLGGFAGLARENVNRHLRKWTQAGIISLEDSTLVVENTAALRALADGS